MLSLIIFILILGVIVTVHEFGHFIFAKLSNTYVYEFSIGMGKKLFGKKRKDGETEFCIRAVPIGGYVMIAGEDLEDEKIPKDRQMCNKSFLQRFMVLFAGAFNNFIFAFIILFISAIIYGAAITKPYIGDVSPDYPAYTAGLEKGDLLLSLNGTKITNWDKALVMLQTSKGNEMTFKVLKQDGSTKEYKVVPIKEKDSEGNESYKFGIATKYEKEYGFTKSLSYAWNKTISLFGSMWDTLKYLFNGKVSINQLSGPVGIYSVVDSQSHQGMEMLPGMFSSLMVLTVSMMTVMKQ